MNRFNQKAAKLRAVESLDPAVTAGPPRTPPAGEINLPYRTQMRLVSLYSQIEGARLAIQAAAAEGQRRQSEYNQQLATVAEALGLDPSVKFDVHLDRGVLVILPTDLVKDEAKADDAANDKPTQAAESHE